MKKFYIFTLLLFAFLASHTQPLTGVKTINAIGGDYTTFTAAINALNTNGVGTGGVIFNVAANSVFAENLPSITATGTATNPVVFQRSGTGANPQIQPTGTTSTSDFGIKDSTADYYTFDGIDVQVTIGNLMEYGYYLQGSATNGCTNIIIKNCNIVLNKANTASKGIYMLSAATSAAAANSNNKFYNINVSNCYNGYHLAGNATYPDDNTEIGILTGGTASISNIGGGTTTQANGLLIANQTNLKVFNQNLQNITTTTTGQVCGINQSGSNTTASYYNNNISDITTGTSGAVYGFLISAGKTQNVYSNVIRNLSSVTGAVAGISASPSNATDNFYNNNISAISNGATATTNSVYGITNSGASVTLSIYGNIIYGINYGGTTTGVAAGLNSSGTDARIYNNVVYGITAANSTTKPTARGIALNTATSYIYLYHNTVYLDGAVNIATTSSAALFLAANAYFDFRNNIFVNNGTNTSGGKLVAQYRAATTYANFTNTTDNNLYFAGTPSVNNLINYDGTNADQTLVAFQTRMAGKEQHSVSELPPFVSAANLHLSTTIATQCENGGQAITTPFPVNTDIEAHVRGTAYVDLGAYEGTYLPKDLTGPFITYTPLLNTTFLQPRTITATIKDVAGIPTSGAGLPVLYWKLNSGTYTAATGTYISGNTYSFTFGATAITGDVVSYYIAAQDNIAAPNTLAWPNAGNYTANPPAAGTAPTSPTTYSVLGGIQSQVNVGVGQMYTSLTNAGGLFDAINNNLLKSDVVAKITSNLTETGTYELKPWLEEGEGVGSYTLRIIPATSSLKVISGNVSANAMIRLSGVKRVVIDGSPDKTDRYLLFRNLSDDYPTMMLYNDASKDSIMYCIIEGNYLYEQLGVFTITNGVVTGNDSNVITHNYIRNRTDVAAATAKNLFYSIGTSATVANSGNEASYNTFSNFGYNGFNSVENNENWLIKGNEFFNTINGGAEVFAINFGSNGNNLITENLIHDVKFTAGAASGSAAILIANAGNTVVSKNSLYNFPASLGEVDGILFWGSSSNPVTLTAVNNQIIMMPTTTSSQVLYGIQNDAYAVNTLNAYYNSIYISGTSAGGAQDNSYAYMRGGSVGAAVSNVRNNIFFNNRTGGYNFAIGNEKFGATGVGNFTVSNNLYIGKGTTPENYFQLGTGFNAVNFAQWVAANRDISSYGMVNGALDPNSLFGDVNSNSLNINNASSGCWYVHGKGLPLTGFSEEYNGLMSRSTTLQTGSTDIGSQEFTTNTLPIPFTISGTHAAGQTESFDFAGRTLASITWGYTGTLPTLGTARHYTGEWPNDSTNNNTVHNARFLNEYWDLPATGGTGYNYSIKLNYDSAMLGTIATEATMLINKKQTGVAGTWVIVAPTTVNTNTKMLEAAGLTVFSEFTASDMDHALPVSLVDFSAVPVANDVRLNWITTSEINNKLFEVQRSINGRDFTSFATVNSNGNNNIQQKYNTTDINALVQYNQKGRIYYRLKTVATNGAITFSQIVVVNTKTTGGLLQAILSNPFNSSFGIAINMPAAGKVFVRLMAQDGKIVLEKSLQSAQGFSTINLQQLDNLAKGIYLLEVSNGTEKAAQKMMKQ